MPPLELPPDFWLALTAIGTLALAAATVFLGVQSRDAVRLGRDQAKEIAEQTKAVRDHVAVAREELEELRRRDRPVLLWDQGGMRPQFLDDPEHPGWTTIGLARQGLPVRIRVRVHATNHGGPAFMTRAAVRGDGELDVETPQKHVPAGGDAYFVDVGFGGIRGGEPYEKWTVLTQEYEALSTGERGEAQVLVAMVSRWHGMNDPFVLVIPLESDEARSDEGVQRWRDELRQDYENYIAAGGG